MLLFHLKLKKGKKVTFPFDYFAFNIPDNTGFATLNSRLPVDLY